MMTDLVTWVPLAGLPGFAAFFRASSLEERTHAQMLMDFQVGKV
jgi:ferritin